MKKLGIGLMSIKQVLWVMAGVSFSTTAFIVYITNYKISDAVVNIGINIFVVFFLLSVGLTELTNKISEYIEIKMLQEKLGNAVSFWDIPSKDKDWIVIFGGMKNNAPKQNQPNYDPDKISSRPSTNTVYAYSEICNCIRTITRNNFKNISFRNLWQIEDDEWDSFSKCNVVFLGGVLTLPGVVDTIFDNSGIKVEQLNLKDGNGARYLQVNNTTLKYNNIQLISQLDGKKLDSDFCFILRMANEKSSIYVFDGNYGVATLAGVKSLSFVAGKKWDVAPDKACIAAITKVEDIDAENPNIDALCSKVDMDGWTVSSHSEKLNFKKLYEEIKRESRKAFNRKILIFDLDDTLANTYRDLFIQLERDAANAISKFVTSVTADEIYNNLLRFRREDPNHIETYLTQLSSDKGIITAYNAVYKDFDITPLSCPDGVYEKLGYLKSRYTLYLVTSGDDKIQTRKIEHLGLSQYFKKIDILASSISKREAFSSIINTEHCHPSRVYIIGNRLDSELMAGQMLGCNTIWIRQGEGSDMVLNLVAENAQNIFDSVEHLEVNDD